MWQYVHMNQKAAYASYVIIIIDNQCMNCNIYLATVLEWIESFAKEELYRKLNSKIYCDNSELFSVTKFHFSLRDIQTLGPSQIGRYFF